MMDWLVNNLGTIIVTLLLAAVVALIVVNHIRKKKQGKSTCGCGCADCPMKKKCDHNS